MISWLSRNNTIVALMSIVEAEYITSCSFYNDAVWIHKLLVGLFDVEMDATDIYCDN